MSALFTQPKTQTQLTLTTAGEVYSAVLPVGMAHSIQSKAGEAFDFAFSEADLTTAPNTVRAGGSFDFGEQHTLAQPTTIYFASMSSGVIIQFFYRQ